MAAAPPTRGETSRRLAEAYTKLPAGQAKARESAIAAVRAAAEAFSDDPDGRATLAAELAEILDSPPADTDDA